MYRFVNEKRSCIVLVIDGFKQGGGQRVYKLLIDQYVKQFTQVFLVVIESTPSDISLPEYDNFKLIYLNSRRFVDVKKMLKLRMIFLKHKPNYIISSFYRSQIWSSVVKLKTSKLIWVEQNTYYSRTKLQWFLMNLLSVRVNKIICVSKEVLTLTNKNICKSAIFIPNPINFPTKIELPRKTRRRNDFLFVGRMIEQKNPEIVIRAFELFISRYTLDSRLHLVGDGELLEEMQNLSLELKIENRCIFYGNIDVIEIFDLMTDLKTLVSVSTIEGFGLARLEALANGCCVISTNTGGAKDFLFFEEDIGNFLSDLSLEMIVDLMHKSLGDKYWNLGLVNERINLVKQFHAVDISRIWLE